MSAPLPELLTSWVYFIQAGGDGPIKIGVAQSPEVRLRILQIEDNAEAWPILKLLRLA